MQFLRRVLPTDGYYAMVSLSNGVPKQFAVSSVDDLYNRAVQASTSGTDAYFGLSSFEQSWHTAPNGNKKVFRTKDNAKNQRSFWLDVDVGEDKPYKTIRDAAIALQNFSTTTGLPLPIIVGSGYGLHLYWALDTDVTKQDWLPTASKLQSVCSHVGFSVDPARTTDTASILRVPGTNNYKRGTPAPVQVLGDAPDISFQDFNRILDSFIESNGVTNTPVLPTIPKVSALAGLSPEVAKQLASAFALPQLDKTDHEYLPIVKRCKQIRFAGRSSEPVWLGMMRVLKYCTDGVIAARQISQVDSRFSEPSFMAKWEYVQREMNQGPTRCDFLERENPDHCRDCKFLGKVTSPIQLADIQEVELPTIDPITPQATPVVTHATLFPLQDPRFSIRYDDGIYYTEEDRNGDTTTTKISDQAIAILFAQIYDIGFAHREVVYITRISSKHEPARQVRLTSKDLQSLSSFRAWCFNAQLMTTPSNEKHMETLMRVYVAQLQRKVPQVKMLDTLGWTDAKAEDGANYQGFVIGDTLYAGGMPATTIGLSKEMEHYAKTRFGSEGTIETWRDEVAGFYNTKEMMWAQFGICLAFGSVLMRLAPGAAKNGIVNFWSRESGTGKTTLQQVINSVWGHPTTQLQNVQSTDNARFKITGWRHSLPTCINETTNLNERELSNVLFNLSEGQEKERMNQEGGLRESGTWQLITIMSANNTVLDKMQSYMKARDAEVRRVLEVEVPKSSVTREEAARMTRYLETNYGVVGRFFIQRLLDTKDYETAVTTFVDNWVRNNSKGQDERYWENTVAMAIVGGQLAKSFGILPYDIKAVESFAMEQIAIMRDRVSTSYTPAAEQFSDFLLDQLADMLVVASANRPKGSPADQAPIALGLDLYVKQMPKRDLTIRVEVDTSTVYVRGATLSSWCNQNGWNRDGLLNDLADAGMYTPGSKSINVILGKGVAHLPQSQSRCYKFTIPAISEAVESAEVSDVQV